MNRVALSFYLMLLLLLPLVAPLVAAEPVKIVGIVSIAEDNDWNITAVKLTATDAAVYQVVLDENGKKLGNEMDGVKVEVTCTVAEKDGAKWITVTAYKEIPE